MLLLLSNFFHNICDASEMEQTGTSFEIYNKYIFQHTLKYAFDYSRVEYNAFKL